MLEHLNSLVGKHVWIWGNKFHALGVLEKEDTYQIKENNVCVEFLLSDVYEIHESIIILKEFA